jgi:hypothetical protein
MFGSLSAVGVIPNNVAQNFGVTEIVPGIFVAPAASAVAIQAEGSIVATGTISAASINFTGQVLNTYSTPVTATGEFLVVNIGSEQRAIRLWNF